MVVVAAIILLDGCVDGWLVGFPSSFGCGSDGDFDCPFDCGFLPVLGDGLLNDVRD